MLLVTVDELETHLRATFSPEDVVRATQEITVASAAIQRYCNLVSLEQLTDDAVKLRGVYGMDLVLPRGPIDSVASVAVDGESLTADDYELVLDTLIRPAGWGGTSVVVDITYTHGYAVVPDDVKLVCLDVTSRAWDNPAGVRSESIDGYSVTHGAAAGRLSEDDKAALSGYHRSAGSVIRS